MLSKPVATMALDVDNLVQTAASSLLEVVLPLEVMELSPTLLVLDKVGELVFPKLKSLR